MRTPRRSRIVTGALFALAAAAAAQAQERAPSAPSPLPWGLDLLAERDSGPVIGYVLEAGTKRPIAGATVRVAQGGEFAQEGPGVATTDERGRFEVQAAIGRKGTTTTFNLFESFQRTKEYRLDVGQLDLQVTHADYQAFTGRVRVDYVSSRLFGLFLYPVCLAPAGAPLTSFAVQGSSSERLRSFLLSSAVVASKGKLTISATLEAPYEPKAERRVLALLAPGLIGGDWAGLSWLSLPNEELLNPQQIGVVELEAESAPKRTTGPVTYSAEVKVEKTDLPRQGQVALVVLRDDDEVDLGEVPSHVLQVIPNEAQRPAAELCRQAYRAGDREELDRARTLAQAAVEADPNYAFARELLGQITLELNQPDVAEAAFQRVTALSNATVKERGKDARRRITDLLVSQQAEATLLAGRPEEAVAALDAIDRDHDDFEKLVALAANLTPEAARKQHTFEPKMSPRFHYVLGRCHLALGNLQRADLHLQYAGLLPPDVRQRLALERARAYAAQAPDDPAAHAALGTALGDAGRWEEALVELRLAARMSPQNPWAAVDLARALVGGAARPLEGAEVAQRAADLAPTNAEAQVALGRALLLLGDYAGAAGTFGPAAAAVPSNFAPRHGNGLARLCLGDAQGAAPELAAAAAMSYAKGEVGVANDVVSLLTGAPTTKVFSYGFEPPEAAIDFELVGDLTTLRQHPDFTPARLGIGGALARLGCGAAALAWLEPLVAADPSLIEARYYAALARESGEDHAGAETGLRQVLAANPLHPLANRDLGRVLMAQGRLAEAQAALLQQEANYPRQEVETEAPPSPGPP